ncbi:MAG TPA: tetratricopeptide repeat protein [Nitrospiraceae bacterium]|jgi:tetratricopeptide (TPR) repeat protein
MGPPGWCLAFVIILAGTVLPAGAEDQPADLLDISQQMVALERSGNDTAVLRLAKQALDMAEEAFGPDGAHVAIYADYLGMAHLKIGQEREAEPLFIRALDIREKTLGLDHTIIAVTLRHLAESYRRSGQTTKAVSSLQRALTIDEHVIGNEAVVATNLQRLGTIFLDAGRYPESEPLLLRALGIQEQLFGLQHPHAATTLEQYARLLRATNREDAAARAEARIERSRNAVKK